MYSISKPISNTIPVSHKPCREFDFQFYSHGDDYLKSLKYIIHNIIIIISSLLSSVSTSVSDSLYFIDVLMGAFFVAGRILLARPQNCKTS